MNPETQEAIDILRNAVTPTRRICHCGELVDKHYTETHLAVPMDEPEETALNVLVDQLQRYERLSVMDLLRLWCRRFKKKVDAIAARG